MVIAPQSLVADQVRVIIVVQLSITFETSENAIVTLSSQLSMPVAMPVSMGSVEASQATVIAGGQLISGGVKSLTLTNWVHEAVFPQLSVAVKTQLNKISQSVVTSINS